MGDLQNQYKTIPYIPSLDVSHTFDREMAAAAREVANGKWVNYNKELSIIFRYSHDYLLAVYRMAESFLDEKLGKDYTLPVDVRTLAERCNFTTESKDFKALRQASGDHTFAPVAQLEMRSISNEDGIGKIAGTISVAENLGESSIRFSIAHELSHYVLRKYNPIGLSYLHEACPGMYALCDSDELLSDAFAYAILLPYKKFIELREAYEADNSRWPINYSDWISYLRDNIQIPEYHVVLAYQNIKQYTIALRLQQSMASEEKWLKSIIKWLTRENFSKSEIKDILKCFHEDEEDREEEAEAKEKKNILEHLAETIDVVQDEMYSEQKCGQAPQPTSDEQPDLTKTKYSFTKWKKDIIKNLFDYGMMDDELESACEALSLDPQYAEELLKS